MARAELTAAAEYEVVIVAMGDGRYEEVIGALRADWDLRDLMYVQADFDLVERPDKVWIVAVDPGGRVLAWCAYEPTEEAGAEVKCVDSCERPECWDEDVYGVVYAVRHELVRRYDAATYVFEGPLDLHRMDGWEVFVEGGAAEPDVPEDHWYGLRRPADLPIPLDAVPRDAVE